MILLFVLVTTKEEEGSRSAGQHYNYTLKSRYNYPQFNTNAIGELPKKLATSGRMNRFVVGRVGVHPQLANQRLKIIVKPT